jgi:hypothetical protein
MTDWKQIYEASREYIRTQTASGLFVAAVYAVIGVLGLFLISMGRDPDVSLGILFLAVGLIGVLFLGVQAFRDYYGSPLILTLRVLRKQDAVTYNQNGTLHRYYLQVDISKAMRVNSAGELTIVPYRRWEVIPVSTKLFASVHEDDMVIVACTPAGVAFATLDDLRRLVR